MKTLVLLIIGLFVSVGIALLVKQDPGYVLITVGQWTVETTVAVFLVVALVLFFVLYKLLRWATQTAGLAKTMRKSAEQRKTRKAHHLLSTGMSQLTEGQWDRAEKALAKSASIDGTSSVGYLGAAKAAQELGRIEQRDTYLRGAVAGSQGDTVAVELTRAELLLANGETGGALKVLRHLHQQVPKQPQVLRRLLDVYQEAKDWESLWQILPDLKKRGVLNEDQHSELERKVHRELLALKARQGNIADLHDAWRRAPRKVRSDPDMIVDYAGYLDSHNEGDEAEAVIRKALDYQWSSKLVLAYGELARSDLDNQIKYIDAWVETHPRDPDLLLTAGRIARRKHLWSKARGYYEASLAAKPTPDAYQELGSLLDQLEEPEKAHGCYRNGLQLLTGRELSTSSTVLEVTKPDNPGSSNVVTLGESPAPQKSPIIVEESPSSRKA